jgi:hypothetical protein
MNTTEINAANLNNAVLVSQSGSSAGTRIFPPFSNKQLTPGQIVRQESVVYLHPH